MQSPAAIATGDPPAERALRSRNRHFYDRLWTDARLTPPSQFNTWPLVQSLLHRGGPRLEIAPGLRPRLPIAGTCFLDISLPALVRLRGDKAAPACTCGTATALPFPDRSFALLCALDIIEHLADDEAALAELSRVAREDAVLLLSVPLHQADWSGFDRVVGHFRRYDPRQLVAKLARHGFAVERSAVFGMRPRSSLLARFGLWFLARRRAHAMNLYNRVFFPLAMRRQKPLRLCDGLLPTDAIGEVLLVCRRSAGS